MKDGQSEMKVEAALCLLSALVADEDRDERLGKIKKAMKRIENQNSIISFLLLVAFLVFLVEVSS